MKEKLKINQENSNQKFGKYERKEKRNGKKGKMRWGTSPTVLNRQHLVTNKILTQAVKKKAKELHVDGKGVRKERKEYWKNIRFKKERF